MPDHLEAAVSFDIPEECPPWNYCRIIRLLFKSEVKSMSNQSFGREAGAEKKWSAERDK